MPEASGVRGELRFIVRVLAVMLGLLWSIELIDALVLGGGLDAFGVQPRSVAGLVGVATMPLLHAHFAHLLSNTIGILVFGTLVLMYGRREFLWVTLAAWLFGGLGAWLLGSAASVHIGASGLVFGYFGYVLMRGVYERRFLSIVISLVIGLLFGGTLAGAIPGLADAGISWQGHLFGLLGGVLVARRHRKRAAE